MCIRDRLTSLSTNYNRRNPSAGLFEIAKIYIPKSVPVTELPDEPVKVTIGMYGEIDFFNIKGIVEHTICLLYTSLGSVAGIIVFNFTLSQKLS